MEQARPLFDISLNLFTAVFERSGDIAVNLLNKDYTSGIYFPNSTSRIVHKQRYGPPRTNSHNLSHITRSGDCHIAHHLLS